MATGLGMDRRFRLIGSLALSLLLILAVGAFLGTSLPAQAQPPQDVGIPPGMLAEEPDVETPDVAAVESDSASAEAQASESMMATPAQDNTPQLFDDPAFARRDIGFRVSRSDF